MGIENWYQLGAFGVVATILIVVLIQQGRRHDKLVDSMIDVVRTNTAAMVSMEKALNGLPAFMQRVGHRLEKGDLLFDNHTERLEQLEKDQS